VNEDFCTNIGSLEKRVSSCCLSGYEDVLYKDVDSCKCGMEL
jgi:hypothetical protein